MCMSGCQIVPWGWRSSDWSPLSWETTRQLTGVWVSVRVWHPILRAGRDRWTVKVIHTHEGANSCHYQVVGVTTISTIPYYTLYAIHSSIPLFDKHNPALLTVLCYVPEWRHRHLLLAVLNTSVLRLCSANITRLCLSLLCEVIPLQLAVLKISALRLCLQTSPSVTIIIVSCYVCECRHYIFTTN